MMTLLNFQVVTFFNFNVGVYTFGLNKAADLNPFIYFARLNSSWHVEALADITACDTSTLKPATMMDQTTPGGNGERDIAFLLIYNFVSYSSNFRLQLLLRAASTTPSITLTEQFKGATWLEREIWDMQGVIFALAMDLRRILTDYGFQAFPLRKSFPISGFMEIFYNEYFKRVKYTEIGFMQGFRLFKFKI